MDKSGGGVYNEGEKITLFNGEQEGTLCVFV
jgi:hypothetical protein